MICANCKGDVPAGNAFCHLCGWQMGASAAPAQAGAVAGTAGPITIRRVPSEASRYAGSAVVSWYLAIIGWGLAVLTPIFGILVVTSNGDDSGGDEISEGELRFYAFLFILIVGWLYASAALWLNYSLRLLGDIERNTKT